MMVAILHVKKVFVVIVAFRLLNALLCQTWFVPDEPWQSLEVAHRMVFGYGHLTWEWQQGIRGYTHPFIFAVLYKCLQLLGMDWAYTLIILPRLLQAMCAAVADVCLHQLASRMFGHSVGNFTLLCNIFNWFTFYCVTRTLTNSLEAILGVIGVYLLYHRSFTSGIVVAALSCLIRPTGAILWIPVFLLHLYWMNINDKLVYIIKLIAVGSCALCWSLIIDRIFYGKWICVQYRFLLFNVLEGKSAMFGTHPWHWYFSQGAPVVLFTLLPSFVIGGLTVTNHKALYFISLLYIIVHSVLDHKEFRFIFPVVPFVCIYAGYHLNYLWTKCNHWGFKWLVAILLVSNVPMMMYFSLIHQRGSLAIIDELRMAIDDHHSPPSVSVLFLTNCHATPYYSHIHRNVSMHFLSCSKFEQPNEVDKFFSNPPKWLGYHYSSLVDLPTHLIMFNSLLPSVEQFLIDNHYHKASEVFHTHIVDDDKDGNYILMYVKDKQINSVI